MPAFNSDAINDVKSACEATAVEAADAISRAFDKSIQLSIEDGSAFDAAADLSSWNTAGLAIVLNVESEAALVLISEESGLLPDWYTTPDPTGESKLATLGQELGMTLLPEEFMAMEFEVKAVDNLAEACVGGAVGSQPAKLMLQLTADGKPREAMMVWPLTNPSGVFEGEPAAEPAPAPAAPAPSAAPSPAGIGAHRSRISNFQELPSYSRTLLHIQVPIRVILAAKKMKVHDIENMGVGTIIQFDKSCEDTLDVEIGRQKIAEGEAVKIGDKFGVRVTSMTMPEERYIALKARKRVR
ncbi:FliM/FliN family flagellar motor C-terminal domain-containing protein [Bremerella sp. JC817]|uniref:FliM/FliN family flagellar motor C-terminal domain-containing protein n=1 Tax=Bremerella sp. JC817 TaxID=3231756 RepID=UPI003459A288